MKTEVKRSIEDLSPEELAELDQVPEKPEENQDDPELQRLREASPILNPSRSNYSMRGVLDLSSESSIDRELAILRGSTGKLGHYYLDDTWKIAYIPFLKSKLDDIRKEFERRSQDAVMRGWAPLQNWPDDLFEKRQKLEYQSIVAMEEVEYLEARLAVLRNGDGGRDLPPILHRKRWNVSKLTNGRLEHQGGFRTSMDDDGVMIIDDKRSPFNGMKVSDFLGFIVTPMQKEFSTRRRVERSRAKRENRPVKRVPYPEAGTVDELGRITYPADYITFNKNLIEDGTK